MTLKAKQLLDLRGVLVNKVPVAQIWATEWYGISCMLWLPCTRLYVPSLALYKIKQIGYLLAYDFGDPSNSDKAYQVAARSYVDSKYCYFADQFLKYIYFVVLN